MKVINKSRKIIAIAGEPLLPSQEIELPLGFDSHPSIKDYLKRGIIADAAVIPSFISGGIEEAEKARIAEEAIARYKAEKEALAAEQAEREAEIKAIKSMKKEGLLKKAASMGLDVKDDDAVEVVREKITAALTE